jgi:hypothetical protein
VDEDTGAAWIRMRLLNVRLSRRFRRFDAELDSLISDDVTRGSIRALLLVEMTARPTWLRAVEWVVAWVTRGRIAKTRGPLQLRDAPFRFRDAVRHAEDLVRPVRKEVELARLWYGTSGREPGSRVAYTTALIEARRILT